MASTTMRSVASTRSTSTSTHRPKRYSSRRSVVVACTSSCPKTEKKEGVKKAVASAALSAFLAAGVPTLPGVPLAAEPAEAGPLVPCETSKAFKKREKNEVKALEKRLKLVRTGLRL